MVRLDDLPAILVQRNQQLKRILRPEQMADRGHPAILVQRNQQLKLRYTNRYTNRSPPAILVQRNQQLKPSTAD